MLFMDLQEIKNCLEKIGKDESRRLYFFCNISGNFLTYR